MNSNKIFPTTTTKRSIISRKRRSLATFCELHIESKIIQSNQRREKANKHKIQTHLWMDLFTTVARLPYSILGHHRNDTVIADRLNYKYTVILFVIFSIVVSNKQFGSEQIVCWSPGHFVQNYVNYVNQVRIK